MRKFKRNILILRFTLIKINFNTKKGGNPFFKLKLKKYIKQKYKHFSSFKSIYVCSKFLDTYPFINTTVFEAKGAFLNLVFNLFNP